MKDGIDDIKEDDIYKKIKRGAWNRVRWKSIAWILRLFRVSRLTLKFIQLYL